MTTMTFEPVYSGNKLVAAHVYNGTGPRVFTIENATANGRHTNQEFERVLLDLIETYNFGKGMAL